MMNSFIEDVQIMNSAMLFLIDCCKEIQYPLENSACMDHISLLWNKRYLIRDRYTYKKYTLYIKSINETVCLENKSISIE